MAGLVVKELKDANGATFDAYFYDDDTALFPVHINVNSAAAAAAFGAGNVGATVPRVTLADDDPAVAAIEAVAASVGVAPAVNAGANSNSVQRVTIATDDALTVAMQKFSQAVEYETVAASQTAQVLGGTGATGDYISGILVIPATTSPGNVLLLDNATSITVFTGGASSVSNLVPFMIPLGINSVSGAWKITTGANVSCIGIGNFSA